MENIELNKDGLSTKLLIAIEKREQEFSAYLQRIEIETGA